MTLLVMCIVLAAITILAVRLWVECVELSQDLVEAEWEIEYYHDLVTTYRASSKLEIVIDV